MIQISPYNPEIEAIWQAIFATGARSIAVVCAQPGEGTSQIAAALARRAGLFAATDAAGQLGRPASANTAALLVDLDIVRPSLARLLDKTPEPDEIIRMDDMGFALLGNIAQDSAQDWRERPRLVEQLMAWRSEWSTVVIDTAPLLTVERRRARRGTAADRRAGANTAEVAGITAAAAADVCVLVTLAGSTSGNRIREARDKLATAGANLIGSILNDCENPSLLAELDRETYRLGKYFPGWMGKIRARMHRSPILTVRV